MLYLEISIFATNIVDMLRNILRNKNYINLIFKNHD